MGCIASELSDFTIITSDNPRNEDPAIIIKDIEAEIEKDNYIVISDRRTAIRMAVLLASPGDIVVIAGKGHEDYQEIEGVRHPFSDRKVLEEAIVESTVVSTRGRVKKRYAGAAQCLR
jgi:UDP-N-acetylmuramoyl-L-alanyl-D-glutamate--2,6-diaminopimelate ligase